MLLEKISHQTCVVSDEQQSPLQWFGRVEKLRHITGLPDLGERRSSSSCRDCKPERCEEVREKCSYYTTHQCKLDPPHKRYNHSVASKDHYTPLFCVLYQLSEFYKKLTYIIHMLIYLHSYHQNCHKNLSDD